MKICYTEQPCRELSRRERLHNFLGAVEMTDIIVLSASRSGWHEPECILVRDLDDTETKEPMFIMMGIGEKFRRRVTREWLVDHIVKSKRDVHVTDELVVKPAQGVN